MDMSSEDARDFTVWRLFSRAETDATFLWQVGMSSKVGVIGDNNNNSELLRSNLLTLPRISFKCKIQFI